MQREYKKKWLNSIKVTHLCTHICLFDHVSILSVSIPRAPWSTPEPEWKHKFFKRSKVILYSRRKIQSQRIGTFGYQRSKVMGFQFENS